MGIINPEFYHEVLCQAFDTKENRTEFDLMVGSHDAVLSQSDFEQIKMSKTVKILEDFTKEVLRLIKSIKKLILKEEFKSLEEKMYQFERIKNHLPKNFNDDFQELKSSLHSKFNEKKYKLEIELSLLSYDMNMDTREFEGLRIEFNKFLELQEIMKSLEKDTQINGFEARDIILKNLNHLLEKISSSQYREFTLDNIKTFLQFPEFEKYEKLLDNTVLNTFKSAQEVLMNSENIKILRKNIDMYQQLISNHRVLNSSLIRDTTQKFDEILQNRISRELKFSIESPNLSPENSLKIVDFLSKSLTKTRTLKERVISYFQNLIANLNFEDISGIRRLIYCIEKVEIIKEYDLKSDINDKIEKHANVLLFFIVKNAKDTQSSLIKKISELNSLNTIKLDEQTKSDLYDALTYSKEDLDAMENSMRVCKQLQRIMKLCQIEEMDKITSNAISWYKDDLSYFAGECFRMNEEILEEKNIEKFLDQFKKLQIFSKLSNYFKFDETFDELMKKFDELMKKYDEKIRFFKKSNDASIENFIQDLEINDSKIFEKEWIKTLIKKLNTDQLLSCKPVKANKNINEIICIVQERENGIKFKKFQIEILKEFINWNPKIFDFESILKPIKIQFSKYIEQIQTKVIEDIKELDFKGGLMACDELKELDFHFEALEILIINSLNVFLNEIQGEFATLTEFENSKIRKKYSNLSKSLDSKLPNRAQIIFSDLVKFIKQKFSFYINKAKDHLKAYEFKISEIYTRFVQSYSSAFTNKELDEEIKSFVEYKSKEIEKITNLCLSLIKDSKFNTIKILYQSLQEVESYHGYSGIILVLKQEINELISSKLQEKNFAIWFVLNLLPHQLLHETLDDSSHRLIINHMELMDPLDLEYKYLVRFFGEKNKIHSRDKILVSESLRLIKLIDSNINNNNLKKAYHYFYRINADSVDSVENFKIIQSIALELSYLMIEKKQDFLERLSSQKQKFCKEGVAKINLIFLEISDLACDYLNNQEKDVIKILDVNLLDSFSDVISFIKLEWERLEEFLRRGISIFDVKNSPEIAHAYNMISLFSGILKIFEDYILNKSLSPAEKNYLDNVVRSMKSRINQNVACRYLIDLEKSKFSLVQERSSPWTLDVIMEVSEYIELLVVLSQKIQIELDFNYESSKSILLNQAKFRLNFIKDFLAREFLRFEPEIIKITMIEISQIGLLLYKDSIEYAENFVFELLQNHHINECNQSNFYHPNKIIEHIRYLKLMDHVLHNSKDIEIQNLIDELIKKLSEDCRGIVIEYFKSINYKIT